MLTELHTHILLAFIAICSNFLSALAGGGAGLIQLPSLLFLGLPFSKAIATHKVATVSLGIGASIRHLKDISLNRKISLIIIICGIPGVILGAKTILFIPEKVAIFCLGILILSLGIFSFIKKKEVEKNNKPISSAFKLYKGAFVIFLIALLNGSLSSGTGLILTFWLVNWFNFSYTQAIAYTLTLVGIIWNGTGALVLGMHNEINWLWIPALIVGSLLGGYLGAHFSIILGDKIAKKAYEFLTLLVGISLLARVFTI